MTEEEFCKLNENDQGLNGGAGLIALEVCRQRDVEGFSPEHDDKHIEDELIRAAKCYLDHVVFAGPPGRTIDWPFEKEWFKPTSRRASLIKAGALIAAELDRMNRAGR